MLYHNYFGLTYRWDYGNKVTVFDGKVKVAEFGVGYWDDDTSHSEFLLAVANWERDIWLNQDAD